MTGMNSSRKSYIFLSFFACVTFSYSYLFAAEKEGPKPALWEELRSQLRSTRNFRLGAAFNYQILKDGERVYYQKALPPSTAAAVYSFNAVSGTETKILDASMLSAGDGPVSAEEKALRERLRLMTSGINFYEADETGRSILTPLKGKLFVYDTETKKAKEIAAGKGSVFSPKLSPDGKKVAFVRDSNLFVTSLDGGAIKALTRGGKEEKSFGVAEFIAQEELDRTDGFWWSPDSRTLLYQEVDQSDVERLSIADPFRADAEPQRPYYPRPGKKNVKFRFGFVGRDGGPTRWIDFGKEPFEYVATVRWTKNGPPTFLLLDRLQNKARLVSADVKTGKTSVLVTETDDAWVEVMSSMPLWLPKDQGFLWLSDRSGSRQITWMDKSGKLLKDLKIADANVKNVMGINKEGTEALVEIANDGSHSSLIKLALASGEVSVLSKRDGGSVTAASKFENGLYVAREVAPDGSDQSVLRRWDGSLEKVVPSSAAAPVMKANVTLQTTGPDAVQTAIIRPSNFDPKRKYAVLEHAYGGPSSLMVRASGRAYLEDQVMADAMGAIIVRMDTRGTPDRGRAWEKAIKNRFGVLPVDEHAAVLKILCQKFEEFDCDRIGVFGWSYGGYFAAYAVLARPDIYKAGVAGAPPVDWLDYDTAYTERYLGLPSLANQAYETASLLPLLKKSKSGSKPLLIIHGTGDDNVFFFNSLKLVDALEREGRPYEFLPLMGMTHMVPDEALDVRRFERTLSFFRKELRVTH